MCVRSSSQTAPKSMRGCYGGQPMITCWTSDGPPYENLFDLSKFSAMPFLFIQKTERTEKRVSNASIAIDMRLGLARSILSMRASLWNGIIIAEDKNFHMGSKRMPFTKSSTNFRRRLAVNGRPTMSRNSSHVHPSRNEGHTISASM